MLLAALRLLGSVPSGIPAWVRWLGCARMVVLIWAVCGLDYVVVVWCVVGLYFCGFGFPVFWYL